MLFLENWQAFDLSKNWTLLESFMEEYNINHDVLEFATDYYGLTDWVEAILDYYDLDLSERLRDNWEEYEEEEEEEEN